MKPKKNYDKSQSNDKKSSNGKFTIATKLNYTPHNKSDFETLKRSSIVCLMYLFFGEGNLQPACMSYKSPGMLLQAGLDAAPDLILCMPYFEI